MLSSAPLPSHPDIYTTPNAKPSRIKTPKPTHPNRLASTQGMSRDEWLAVRRQGIGSSDAAAAIGLNPYQSPLELWMIKTGRTAGLPQIDPNDEESPTYWGTLLEPIVAQHYTQRTGYKVRRINAVLQHPHHDWMLANIDREVIGAPDVQVLECKTAGLYGAHLWKEGIPEYVQVQVMHQLAVTGKEAADIAVLLAGQVLRIYRIERDDRLIEQLIQLEKQFWDYVTRDVPPPADSSCSSAQALRALYPNATHTELDWTQDIAMNAAFDRLLEVRAHLASYQDEEHQLKHHLQHAMGQASRARLVQGHVTWQNTQPRCVIDTERLSQDHPALLATYRSIQAAQRRFCVSTSASTHTKPAQSFNP